VKTLVKRLMVVGLLMSSAGCVSLSSYTIRDGLPGLPVTSNVGSPLVHYESGMKDSFGVIVEREAKQFIYSGKAGSIVRFSYREFAGRRTPNTVADPDMFARPAFTQDVQYDLSESDEIVFQNMRLKVLNATTSEITVEILRELEPLRAPPPTPAPSGAPSAMREK
jgi:hypothetical protein